MKATAHSVRNRFVISALAVLTIFAASSALWWLTLYDNYHVVIPGELYRSGQMDADRLLAHAAADHLATVINLRPETNQPWHAKEVAACAGRNITPIDFPLAGDQAPSRATMTTLVNLMRDAPRPILIHCEHGADRTGLAVALYLSSVAGRSNPEASRALSLRYGHLPTRTMRQFDEALRIYWRVIR